MRRENSTRVPWQMGQVPTTERHTNDNQFTYCIERAVQDRPSESEDDQLANDTLVRCLSTLRLPSSQVVTYG